MITQSDFVTKYCRIHYYSWGTGTPLVFLHGAGVSSKPMLRLLQPLAKKYHIVAVDLPFHGHSGNPQNVMHYPELVDCIAELFND